MKSILIKMSFQRFDHTIEKSTALLLTILQDGVRISKNFLQKTDCFVYILIIMGERQNK